MEMTMSDQEALLTATAHGLQTLRHAIVQAALLLAGCVLCLLGCVLVWLVPAPQWARTLSGSVAVIALYFSYNMCGRILLCRRNIQIARRMRTRLHAASI